MGPEMAHLTAFLELGVKLWTAESQVIDDDRQTKPR